MVMPGMLLKHLLPRGIRDGAFTGLTAKVVICCSNHVKAVSTLSSYLIAASLEGCSFNFCLSVTNA